MPSVADLLVELADIQGLLTNPRLTDTVKTSMVDALCAKVIGMESCSASDVSKLMDAIEERLNKD